MSDKNLTVSITCNPLVTGKDLMFGEVRIELNGKATDVIAMVVEGMKESSELGDVLVTAVTTKIVTMKDKEFQEFLNGLIKLHVQFKHKNF